MQNVTWSSTGMALFNLLSFAFFLRCLQRHYGEPKFKIIIWVESFRYIFTVFSLHFCCCIILKAYSATGELAFNSYWSSLIPALRVISLKSALLWAEDWTKGLLELSSVSSSLNYSTIPWLCSLLRQYFIL